MDINVMIVMLRFTVALKKSYFVGSAGVDLIQGMDYDPLLKYERSCCGSV